MEYRFSLVLKMGTWCFIILSVIIGAVASDGTHSKNQTFAVEKDMTTPKSQILKRIELLSHNLSDKIKSFNDRVNEMNGDMGSILIALSKSKGSYRDELMQHESLSCNYISSCVTTSLSEVHKEMNEMFHTTHKLLEKFGNKLESFSTSATQRIIHLEQKLERLPEMEREVSSLLLVQNDTNNLFKSSTKSLEKVSEQLQSFSTSTTQRMTNLEQKLERLPLNTLTSRIDEMKRDVSRIILQQDESKDMSKITNKSLGKVSEQLQSFSTSTTQRMVNLEQNLKRTAQMDREVSSLLLVQKEMNDALKTTNKFVGEVSVQLQSFATSTKQRLIKIDHKFGRFPEDSGVYFMRPDPSKDITFAVARDWTNNHGFGGNWTVFQRRFNGSVSFRRNWSEYKQGFGDLRGEHWLGLEKLHAIVTTRRHELLIVLEDFFGVIAYAHYDDFQIGDESEKYVLKSVGEYSGTAGDSFTHHKDELFSTYDRDNDNSNSNCAEKFEGGWWFYNCYQSFLNGKYVNGKYIFQDGIDWKLFRGLSSLKSTKMMVRPAE